MKTYFWEASPFFRLLLPFATGILCYDVFATQSLRGFYVSIAVFLCCILLSWVKNRPLIQSVSFFIAFICLGFLVSFYGDVRNDPHWFGNKLKAAEAFSVKITEAPQEKERTWKLAVDVEKAICNNDVEKVKGNAFIYIYKNDSEPNYKIGDRLLVPATWQLLKNPGNPYEFDYATFCKRNNIYYQQFLGANEVGKISDGDTHDVSLAMQTHEWAMKKLAWYVKDKSTLGLLQAMLLGDEVNFSDDDRQLYTDTGIIHVVAISGGHIGFLMVLINACLFFIRKKKHQWIKLVIAQPVVIFYVMVAGAPPSAVRAAFVFSLLAISSFIHRDNNPLNTLLAAAFGILFIKPMWIFAVGFQLSFVAVLSLIIFYKRIFILFYPPNKIIKSIWSIIAASLAAEILVAPLVIYYFHLLPALFLVANVLAVLLMTMVMSLGLLIIATSPISGLAMLLATTTSFLVRWFHKVIDSIRFFNPEAFNYLHLSLAELLLCYACIAAFSMFIIWKSKSALSTSLLTLCALFLSFNIKEWKALHQEQIVVYNVSRHAYTEYISGNQFQILSESTDSISSKKIDYAAKENHVAKRAWQQRKATGQNEIFSFNDKKILFMKQPLMMDSISFQPVDILVIQYPVKDWNAHSLQKTFGFKKLIVTGEQRRKIMQNWKDSCEKYEIDTHFTMQDGAYLVDMKN